MINCVRCWNVNWVGVLMNERISALIDDELDELDQRRVLDALKNDAGLRGTWERYHVIRAALNHQLSFLASPGLPERVRARLEAESDRTAASLRFWPLAGGFAAAASIAVVAIVSVQALRAPTASVGAMPPAVAINAETPVSPAAVAINTEAPLPAVASGGKPAIATPVEATAPARNPGEQLHYYLVGHNEFMPTGGMGNMLPYVRVVVDSQDK
jgi:sigma-E factor negative regulatory protein RseA